MSTLSQKSETVAENDETTATVSLFCDSVDRLYRWIWHNTLIMTPCLKQVLTKRFQT